MSRVQYPLHFPMVRLALVAPGSLARLASGSGKSEYCLLASAGDAADRSTRHLDHVD